MRTPLLLTTLITATLAAASDTPTTKRTKLTLEGARRVIPAVAAEAKKNNAGAAVAVVDGGNLIAIERVDGTFPAGPNIAMGKARTAALYRSDGTLFFTDPNFGLPKFGEDARKELPFTGVFALRNGKLKLVSKELTRPNGLAFSPDEKYLYVGNWDDNKKTVMRYRISDDGTATESKLFFDMTAAPGEDAIDGIKAEMAGNVYVSGPGGLWILSPEGKHLGTIITPKHPHNFAWGGDDGRTLYLCARSGLYRMPLNIAGVRP